MTNWTNWSLTMGIIVILLVAVIWLIGNSPLVYRLFRRANTIDEFARVAERRRAHDQIDYVIMVPTFFGDRRLSWIDFERSMRPVDYTKDKASAFELRREMYDGYSFKEQLIYLSEEEPQQEVT